MSTHRRPHNRRGPGDIPPFGSCDSLPSSGAVIKSKIASPIGGCVPTASGYIASVQTLMHLHQFTLPYISPGCGIGKLGTGAGYSNCPRIERSHGGASRACKNCSMIEHCFPNHTTATVAAHVRPRTPARPAAPPSVCTGTPTKHSPSIFCIPGQYDPKTIPGVIETDESIPQQHQPRRVTVNIELEGHT